MYLIPEAQFINLTLSYWGGGVSSVGPSCKVNHPPEKFSSPTGREAQFHQILPL